MNEPLTEFPDDLEVKVIASMSEYGEGVYFQHGDYVYEMSVSTRFATPRVSDIAQMNWDVRQGGYYFVSQETSEKMFGKTLGEVRRSLEKQLEPLVKRLKEQNLKRKKEGIDKRSPIWGYNEVQLHEQIDFVMELWGLHNRPEGSSVTAVCRNVRHHIRDLLKLPNVQACASVVARIKAMIPALRAEDLANPVLKISESYDKKNRYRARHTKEPVK